MGGAVDFLRIHPAFVGSAASASASSRYCLASRGKARHNLGSSDPNRGRDAGGHVLHVAKGCTAAVRMAINHYCTTASLLWEGVPKAQPSSKSAAHRRGSGNEEQAAEMGDIGGGRKHRGHGNASALSVNSNRHGNCNRRDRGHHSSEASGSGNDCRFATHRGVQEHQAENPLLLSLCETLIFQIGQREHTWRTVTRTKAFSEIL